MYEFSRVSHTYSSVWPLPPRVILGRCVCLFVPANYIMKGYLCFIPVCYSSVNEMALRSFFVAHIELGRFFSLGRDRVFGRDRIFFKYRPGIGIFGGHLICMAVPIWEFVYRFLQLASDGYHCPHLYRYLAVW